MYHVLPCCQRPLLCCLYLGNVARDKLTNSLGVDARLARRDLHRHRQVIIPLKMQLSCSITQRRLPRFKSSSLCQLESFLTSTVLLNYSNAGCVTWNQEKRSNNPGTVVYTNLWHSSPHDVFVFFFVDFVAEEKPFQSRLDFFSDLIHIRKLPMQTPHNDNKLLQRLHCWCPLVNEAENIDCRQVGVCTSMTPKSVPSHWGIQAPP